MKKSLSKNQGKSDDTETKDIREKMEEIDVKPSSSTNSMANNPALLPSGVGQMKQLQGAKMVNQTESSSSGSATGNPRNKTALAPGHSLMDWIRLGNSGVDLTGVGGVPRVVTLSELATHNKQNDAWIAIRGIVFNVTRYMDFHPGGVNELMRGVGKDATKLFENVHAWVNYQSILQKCVVGRLSRGSVSGTTASSPTENAASSTSNCSSATLNLITSCTTHSVNQENVSDANLLNIKMEWRQTPYSLILFYPTPCNYPNMCYQLTKIHDSKLVYKLCFGNTIVMQELELTAEIEWPPDCFRDLEMREMTFTFAKRRVELWKSYGNQTVLRETNMDDRMYTEYEVVTNKPLSKLVHLLVVRAKDFLQIVPIGRHVEVKMNVMGMEISRLYTPVPPCLHPDDMAPNYKSDCLCFMIKKYPNGALSPSITALEIGQTFFVSNALGDFMTEPYDMYTILHMIAGGTGLTVILGVIQQALARRCVRSINLLNFNKDEDNMFYVKELEKASTDSRLKVTHILSQAGDTWKGRRGTISDYLLEELVAPCESNAFVYTCGPPGFILSARNSLRKINWKPCQMYEFED